LNTHDPGTELAGRRAKGDRRGSANGAVRQSREFFLKAVMRRRGAKRQREAWYGLISSRRQFIQ
jgi:hypothetical protein